MQKLTADARGWVESTLGCKVVECELLRAKETQPTWLLRLSGGRGPSTAVLKVSPIDWVAGVKGEATALQLVEDVGLPAPRLLGVDVTGEFGSLFLLQTVVPGTTAPMSGSPRRRMWELGAAAAALHTIALPPGHNLWRVHKPVWPDDYVGARRRGRAPTTPLLEEADSIYSDINQNRCEDTHALAHGDFHHQNVHWANDRVVAYIDWDSAGIGHPGIDVGWSRLEAALAYSLDAADEIAYGWAATTGKEPDSLGYWDLVASLQTDADLGTGTETRDAFLRAALANMEHDR